MDDQQILALYWQRDDAAIAATANSYGSYCYSIAWHILDNEQDAQECLNDTWLSAWNSIPPQRPQQLSTYLGKITRNLAINRFRQRHAQKRGLGQTALALSELSDCIADPVSLEQRVEEKQLTAVINRFLLAQPEQKRHIFIRRYWYLQPIREIAEAYGISESKVASLLLRMRKRLKVYLEKEGIAL